jgi:hypothetical protein
LPPHYEVEAAFLGRIDFVLSAKLSGAIQQCEHVKTIQIGLETELLCDGIWHQEDSNHFANQVS